MNAQDTLTELREHLNAGHKVLDCEVREGEIVIIFEDREIPAPGFKIASPCPPFATFVVEAGLDQLVDNVTRYLAALPSDLEGAICWPGFEDGDI
jgi:hypothetical protein